MENYVGKILGKITPKELKEIKNIAQEKRAVKNALKDLFEKATQQEMELEQEKDEWWDRIRQKYNLPKEKELRKSEIFGQQKVLKLSFETSELYIGLRI